MKEDVKLIIERLKELSDDRDYYRLKLNQEAYTNSVMQQALEDILEDESDPKKIAQKTLEAISAYEWNRNYSKPIKK